MKRLSSELQLLSFLIHCLLSPWGNSKKDIVWFVLLQAEYQQKGIKVAILSGPEYTPVFQVPFTFSIMPNWQYFLYSRPTPMCFFISWQQPHRIFADHINKQTKLISHPDFPLYAKLQQ